LVNFDCVRPSDERRLVEGVQLHIAWKWWWNCFPAIALLNFGLDWPDGFGQVPQDKVTRLYCGHRRRHCGLFSLLQAHQHRTVPL
jgi:hypothetical protein